VAAGAALTAHAHHAMEFIETESATTLRAGEGLVHLHFDRYSEDKNDSSMDHWEWTPGLAFGLTDRLMADMHGHYAKFNNGLVRASRQAQYAPDGPPPFLEAAAITLQYRLTDTAPVAVAVAATVELPSSRARRLLESHSVYAGTLILSRGFAEHSNVTLNLTAGIEDGEGFYEFALGVRSPLGADPHGIAVGLELLGDVEEFSDTWSLLPGIYLPLIGPETVLKTGFEAGRGMERTRLNVTLMHLF
jgi:hypothetical protein